MHIINVSYHDGINFVKLYPTMHDQNFSPFYHWKQEESRGKSIKVLNISIISRHLHHRSSHDSWFIIKQVSFQSSHKAFKEFLKHRRMINLSIQCFNPIQVMNINAFILWVSIHEYHKILFVTSILQDQDYDLDKTYSNQIINLKFIIKSLKLISRFTKYHEIINLDQMGKAFF